MRLRREDWPWLLERLVAEVRWAAQRHLVHGFVRVEHRDGWYTIIVRVPDAEVNVDTRELKRRARAQR